MWGLLDMGWARLLCVFFSRAEVESEGLGLEKQNKEVDKVSVPPTSFPGRTASRYIFKREKKHELRDCFTCFFDPYI